MVNKWSFFPLFLVFCLIFLYSCSTENNKIDSNNLVQQEEASHFVLPPLPDTVFFCDQPIPLDNFDVRERLDKEIIVNTFYHSSTIQSFKRANRYFPLLERELKEQNVPDDFKYLCLIESGLTQAVSPSGAKGFWQFMPKTATEYGLVVNKEIDERLHVRKSTKAACDYLKDGHNKFGNWSLVAASYNMGMGGLQRALDTQEVDDYFDLHLNNETSRYMFRILALKIIFENAEAYGFHKDELELYEPIKTREITLTESIDSLEHWAKEQGTTYRIFKVLNPWVKSNRISVAKKPMVVELPE